jgi:heptosyltransferase-2/heptosyltransferase-3
LLLIRWLVRLLRPFAHPSAAAPRRILVIKPDHLGDVLLLTPALSALRRRFPQAHIAVLVGPWSTRLLAGNPAVDTVLTCPFPGFVRGEAASIVQPYRTLLRYAALLRAGRFDTAIIARDDHWWGGLLALAAGCGRRVGFAHPLLAPTLTSARPWDPQAHVTRQALDLVALLGLASGAGPQSGHTFAPAFFPTSGEQAWAAGWLATNSPGRPLLAIQPGSGGAAKLWPAASWAALARALADRGTLVLTGGAADAADVAAISALLDDLPHHTLVGTASLGQLAALFGRCALVLGVDNGPLHLAVTQGVPTVHLYGPGDHRRFGPWGPPDRHAVVRSGLWCSPCGVLTHCPRATSPSECMTTIAVAPVLAAAQQLLGGG